MDWYVLFYLPERLFILNLPVIAFDAHVLKWNLDDNPPDECARHHVREASFYGTDTWTLDLVMKLPSSEEEEQGLLVQFIGLQEKGMWPAKRAVKAEGGIAMEIFEIMDAWVDEKTGGRVDMMMVGGVAGVVRI